MIQEENSHLSEVLYLRYMGLFLLASSVGPTSVSYPKSVHFSKFPPCYQTHLSPRQSSRLDTEYEVWTERKLVSVVTFSIVREDGRQSLLIVLQQPLVLLL